MNFNAEYSPLPHDIMSPTVALLYFLVIIDSSIRVGSDWTVCILFLLSVSLSAFPLSCRNGIDGTRGGIHLDFHLDYASKNNPLNQVVSAVKGRKAGSEKKSKLEDTNRLHKDTNKHSAKRPVVETKLRHGMNDLS